MCVGAGDGNRTHVASLEGWNSTIELHPRMRDNGAVDETRTRDLHLGKVALYQLSYYRKTMGDRRRRGKQALMKTGAGEETRTHTPVAPDPKSGASAIPPRPHAAYDPHGASAPDSQIRTLIYYTLCAVACQGGNGNFFSASLSRLFTGRAETESRRWRRGPHRSSIPLKGKRANLCRGNVEEFRGRGIDIVFQPC